MRIFYTLVFCHLSGLLSVGSSLYGVFLRVKLLKASGDRVFVFIKVSV